MSSLHWVICGVMRDEQYVPLDVSYIVLDGVVIPIEIIDFGTHSAAEITTEERQKVLRQCRDHHSKRTSQNDKQAKAETG